MKPFLKTTQEQAVASWVNYLNQLRLDSLAASLRLQDVNLAEALSSIDTALTKIELEVVSIDRGGSKGIHGFIAEIAEVGIGNARELISGNEASYTWINDNGPVDLVRGGIDIQQKFSMAGGRFSLAAVAEHLEKYPDYVRNGGRYQIPRDHFETVQRLHSMPQHEAERLLNRGGDGPSFKDWQRINRFFTERSIRIQSVEPSKLDYRDAQKGAYETTFATEKDSLRTTDRSRRNNAYQRSRPSLAEGARASIVSAGIEGGTTLVMAVKAKRKEGISLKEFSGRDWAEVVGTSSVGVAKGGVRGVSIYSLTNFTATSAAVASSVVTATFAVAEQAHRLRCGEIDQLAFIENAELVCLEAAVAALSSLIGQVLIPVPILGAVIGNAVGTIMYRAVSQSLSEKEADLLRRYVANQHSLDEELAEVHNRLLEKIGETLSVYLGVLERAFSPDIPAALLGSVELAREAGVPNAEILDTREKRLAYFLD